MKIPVTITTIASHWIGEVEIETKEEFADAAEKLWESQGYNFPTPCHQEEYDLGEWDIFEEDVDYYFKEQAETIKTETGE